MELVAKKNPRKGKIPKVMHNVCPNKGCVEIFANSTKFVFLDNKTIFCDSIEPKGSHRRYRWKVINKNNKGGFLEVWKEGFYFRRSPDDRVGGVTLEEEEWDCKKGWVRTGISRNKSINKYCFEERC